MDSNKQKILEQLQPDAYITAMTISYRHHYYSYTF